MSEWFDREHDNDTPYKAKKDRKRWCGGKVGKEHVLHVTLPPNVPGWKKEYCTLPPNWAMDISYFRKWRIFCDHVILCMVCGKHMGHPDICPTHGEPVMIEESE